MSSNAKEWARAEVVGLWTSPTTPFLVDGEVDHDGIVANVDRLVEIGADGIGFGFSEPWVMTVQERHESLETFVAAAKGRVKCYAHVTDHSSEESVALGLHAKALGADAVMAWAPFEHAKTEAQMVQYYEYLAQQVKHPLFAYNTPHSGRLFGVDTITQIAGIEHVCALKNAVNDIELSAAAFAAVGDQIVVSEPLEENFPATLERFDQQVLLGTTSVFLFQSPSWTPVRDYYEAFRRGDAEAGWRIYREIQPLRDLWNEIYSILWGGGQHPIATLKAWMDAIGLRGGEVRAPMTGLDDDDRARLLARLETNPVVQRLYPDGLPLHTAATVG